MENYKNGSYALHKLKARIALIMKYRNPVMGGGDCAASARDNSGDFFKPRGVNIKEACNQWLYSSVRGASAATGGEPAGAAVQWEKLL